MSDVPVNHEEAMALAEIKAGESNLARCYLDALRQLGEALGLLSESVSYAGLDPTYAESVNMDEWRKKVIAFMSSAEKRKLVCTECKHLPHIGECGARWLSVGAICTCRYEEGPRS